MIFNNDKGSPLYIPYNMLKGKNFFHRLEKVIVVLYLDSSLTFQKQVYLFNIKYQY